MGRELPVRQFTSPYPEIPLFLSCSRQFGYVSASTIAWQILSCFNITHGDYMRFNNIFWKISLGEFVCVITTGVVPFAVYVSCTEAMLGYGDFSVKSGSNFDLMD